MLLISLLPLLTTAHTPRVLILGAGASGMACAKSLSENGVKDFYIIEGRDSVGGRMTNTRFPASIPNNFVEIGANWIHGVHGTKPNPVWELAEKYNITRTKTTYEDYVVYSKSLGKVNDTYFKQEEAKFIDAMQVIRDYAAQRRAENLVDIDVRTALSMQGWRPYNQNETDLAQVIEYRTFDFDYADSPDKTSLIYAIDDATFPGLCSGFDSQCLVKILNLSKITAGTIICLSKSCINCLNKMEIKQSCF